MSTPATATGATRERVTDADVVVVGAGPTGLLLAGDLATAGLRVTLLEKRPASLSNLSRAFAVHARTLEQLDARGLADELVPTGRAVGEVRLFQHLSVPLDGLPGRFPYVLVTPQYEVERLLRRRAVDAGVDLRFDHEVAALEQDDTGVQVTLSRPDGGSPATLSAAWLVGTDGVRSTVRSAVGVPFPGETVIRAMILADVRLDRAPADVLTVAAQDDALGFLAPFGDGWYRFIGWHGERDLDDPVTLDEVRAVARATLGDDHGMRELRYATRFAADERQAPTYRTGRVLLAGDAAHVHSPAGGLGMNTGLQDAANLSWRLVAVVQGADPSVLDTYQAERHPVGRRVLRVSGSILRLGVHPGPVASAARTLAAAAISRVQPLRRRAAMTVSALGVAYPRPRGSHPWTGRRVPDLPLANGAHGSRLYEALRAGRFVLVVPHGPSPEVPPSAGETDVTERVRVRRTDGSPTTLLVRPDGYLADVVTT